MDHMWTSLGVDWSSTGGDGRTSGQRSQSASGPNTPQLHLAARFHKIRRQQGRPLLAETVLPLRGAGARWAESQSRPSCYSRGMDDRPDLDPPSTDISKLIDSVYLWFHSYDRNRRYRVPRYDLDSLRDLSRAAGELADAIAEHGLPPPPPASPASKADQALAKRALLLGQCLVGRTGMLAEGQGDQEILMSGSGKPFVVKARGGKAGEVIAKAPRITPELSHALANEKGDPHHYHRGQVVKNIRRIEKIRAAEEKVATDGNKTTDRL